MFCPPSGSIAALDPFRLSCPHCASKVVVRHAHLLGQTLPCPKCKGPIAVPISYSSEPWSEPNTKAAAKPPRSTESKSPTHKVVNSGAVTKATDEDWEAVLANENLARAIAQETSIERRFGTMESDAAFPSPLRRPRYLSTPCHHRRTCSPQQAWQSQPSAKRRQILMLTTIALTGSV